MSEKQTEAQRLAALCDSEVAATVARDILMHETAVELRRLDAENEALRDVLRYIANVGEPWQRDYLIREIQAAAEAAILGESRTAITKAEAAK